MTCAEMLAILERMRFALQRYRSIQRAALEDDGHTMSEETLAFFHPWVFGKRCPLLAVQKVLDRGTVTGAEFYNFMFMLHRFMPEVMQADIETDFPQAALEMVHWGKEEARSDGSTNA